MIAIRKSMILPILAVMLIIYLQTVQGIPHSSKLDSSESSTSSSASSDSDSSSSETEESSENSSSTEESNENKKEFIKRFVSERFRRQPYPNENLEGYQYNAPQGNPLRVEQAMMSIKVPPQGEMIHLPEQWSIVV